MKDQVNGCEKLKIPGVGWINKIGLKIQALLCCKYIKKGEIISIAIMNKEIKPIFKIPEDMDIELNVSCYTVTMIGKV